jgi:hypothetical protein
MLGCDNLSHDVVTQSVEDLVFHGPWVISSQKIGLRGIVPNYVTIIKTYKTVVLTLHDLGMRFFGELLRSRDPSRVIDHGRLAGPALWVSQTSLFPLPSNQRSLLPS